MGRGIAAPRVMLVPPVTPGRVGEEMTVPAVTHGRRPASIPMRWSWEDGARRWHAEVVVPPGSGLHQLRWDGVFSVPGIHRIDLRAVRDQRIGAAAFVVVLGHAQPRIAVSGMLVREGGAAPYRAVPISVIVARADAPREVRSEVRWLDGDADVHSQEVSWVIDAPNGWVHLGGTALGELGAVNLFRAHFQVGNQDASSAERAEIRIYPPRANPGVDPPQRVITGPIQPFRRRGSIST